jgi:integration host factor subunit alpha
MTKADIAERIHLNTGMLKKDAMDMLELVLSVMKDTLEAGEKIKISGFGNFIVNHKKDRRGRNPQTGDDMTIEARRTLSFKPSEVLKIAINSERA